MKKTALVLACGLCLVSSVLRADDKADEPKKIESKLTHTGVSPTSVDFRKETGLTFSGLTTLGARIAQARSAADPVGLASAARELAVAEEVSGKKAKITAKSLSDEAIRLVTLRNDSKELKAVSLLTDDAAAKEKLGKASKAAGEAEMAAKQAAAGGKVEKGIVGTLVVINQSPDECVNVYDNGRFLGTVHAGTTQAFHVHDHGESHLDAYCEEGGELVSTTCVFQHTHHYHWIIR